MAERQVLFLYSSNIRPLYEQDILDLLAAPAGHLYRFRYLGWKYVASEVERSWNDLQGTPVLVHFALQQESQYHDPAFIPVRRGEVVLTQRLGDINIIEFTLGDYVALRPSEEKAAEDWQNPAGKVVQDYLSWLNARSVPRPYQHWVGFGPDPGSDNKAPFHQGLDPMILFDRTAKYLSRTASFREARFYRIEGLYRLGAGEDQNEALEPTDGRFVLEGGKTYGLRIAHSQPVEIKQREKFRVASDGEIIHPIGSGGFEISSPYDVFTLPLHASEPPTSEARETVLTIEPEAVRAATVRLKLRVVRSPGRTATAVGGSATAALLLGVPSLLPSAPVEFRVVCVFLAAVLLGLLANWGLKRS